MESRIPMTSGGTIEIPARLLASFDELMFIKLPNSECNSPDERARNLLAIAEKEANLTVGAAAALQAAMIYRLQSNTELTIRSLAIAAQKRAHEMASTGDSTQGIGLLADAMRLVNEALPGCNPTAMSQLTRLLTQLTENALIMSTAARNALATINETDMEQILAVAATVWEPELGAEIHEIAHIVKDIQRNLGVQRTSKLSSAKLKVFAQELERIGDTITGKRPKRGQIRNKTIVLRSFLSAWIEGTQRLIILNASMGGLSESPERDLEKQIQDLVKEVEQRLRELISIQYRQQFGETWVKHIEVKHATMYQYWLRNLERDKAVFKTYRQYSPEILEYSRLDDLSDLITAQWHLFRDVLDFGYDDRNKVVFHDKMSQIARVRNPLAHHRAVPENELLRARVLCTDILLALENR